MWYLVLAQIMLALLFVINPTLGFVGLGTLVVLTSLVAFAVTRK